jgi:hypothetical protein
MICRTRLHDLHAVTCTVARSCRQLPALFVLAFSSSHTNSRHSSLLPVTCLFSDRTPLLFVTFHYFYPPPSCIYALALTTLHLHQNTHTIHNLLRTGTHNLACLHLHQNTHAIHNLLLCRNKGTPPAPLSSPFGQQQPAGQQQQLESPRISPASPSQTARASSCTSSKNPVSHRASSLSPKVDMCVCLRECV